MDLIYTNSRKIEQGVLLSYSIDLSFGLNESENDFELTLGDTEPLLENGASIYFDSTEYGGVIDGLKTNSELDYKTYIGRTWHGIMNNKIIQPDTGNDYYVVSGDANSVISILISRLGLSALFRAERKSSGISISNYRFPRYCKAYDGIAAMLSANGAKLKMKFTDNIVIVYAEKIVNNADNAIDNDIANIAVDRKGNKVNHLICLGKGELAERDIIHLYVDQFGNIGSVQYYTGVSEIAAVYDYGSVESLEELEKSGIKRLKELRDNDAIEVTVSDTTGINFDVGDIITANDIKNGNSGTATVTQKIVKITNGDIKIEYKTGGK